MLRDQRLSEKDFILLDWTFFAGDLTLYRDPHFDLYRALAYRKADRIHSFFDFVVLRAPKALPGEDLFFETLNDFSMPLLGVETLTGAAHYNFFRHASFGYFCPYLDKHFGVSPKGFYSGDPDVFLSSLLREVTASLNLVTWEGINRP